MKMFHAVRNRATSGPKILLLSVCAATVFSLVACGGSDSNKTESSSATAPAAKTFASPEEAGKTLYDAAKTGNLDAVLAIFGQGAKPLISSGNAGEDKIALQGFANAYQVMNRWRKIGDGSEILLVGADNQAFPIPLTSAAGQWHFDVAAGKEELIARRIGRDEIVAIDVCGALADAQAQYFAQKHGGVKQYAQKFISDADQQNGLYWQPAPGAPRSPIGPLVAFATEEGLTIKPDVAQPFYGYYFHRLDSQGAAAKGGAKPYVVNGQATGGFAYVAYPAKYDDTGVQTFIVSQDRVIYQKNLGKDTVTSAKAMTVFDPDKTWTALR
jgi:Protein of unknown function (DUF2950)